MAAKNRKILVIDIGGSHVKCLAPDRKRRFRFSSGPGMTPQEMVEEVLMGTSGWRYDVVSIGYPGVVLNDKPAVEPHNLGPGWVKFGFEASLARPVRMINDAAMQALGGYQGGSMLFLGLGTGLGSALIVDGTIMPLELGHLACGKGRDYEYELGDRGRRRLGDKKWKARVSAVVESFRQALLPEYILLGGGNAKRLKRLPPHARRGKNSDAFRGGFRLWDQRDSPSHVSRGRARHG